MVALSSTCSVENSGCQSCVANSCATDRTCNRVGKALIEGKVKKHLAIIKRLEQSGKRPRSINRLFLAREQGIGNTPQSAFINPITFPDKCLGRFVTERHSVLCSLEQWGQVCREAFNSADVHTVRPGVFLKRHGRRQDRQSGEERVDLVILVASILRPRPVRPQYV